MVWVWAEEESGRIGIGEAVPLPGYNWETLDSIRSTVAEICEGADDALISDVLQRCRAARREHPFAASAVISALELPLFLKHASSSARFPVSAPVSSDWPLPLLRTEVNAQLATGYHFIKMKVGRDFDCDIAAARCLLTEWPGKKFRVVFDSNQAHTTEEGLAFARVLRECASDRLQWYEQPVDRRDWDGMERICRAREAPIVLDECIYDEADVVRAAAIGASGVKLKLIKNFGIAETLSLARRGRKLGLFVVFGNGVASDVGNFGEYLTLAAEPGLFAEPSECSGFAKLKEPVIGSVLSIENGYFACPISAAAASERIREFAAAQAVEG